jgi:AcrR family transcriptional regulator
VNDLSRLEEAVELPRISPERREARRAEIVAAARRRFARDGFHQTSMPDIAAEAGVAVGAPYRYFANKDEIIVTIAADAFRVLFEPVERLAERPGPVTAADLVAASTAALSGDVVPDAAGNPVPVEEMLGCAVQAWAELLRNDGVRTPATEGFEKVRGSVAAALRRGQEAGTAPAGLEPGEGARVIMALLHGFLLQRVAFGHADTEGFTSGVRALLGP